MSTGYKIDNQEGAYYITLQIVNWADLFSRQVYRDIVIDNLRYCIANKGLIVYAYVIMSNHVHLLVQSNSGQLSNTIRDFKSYTSKKFIQCIEQNKESRSEWLLNVFKQAASMHKRNSHYQVWTHENHAVHVYSDKFVTQKLDYIHMNPVRAGLVRQPEDYIYSSACNYADESAVLAEVEVLTLTVKTVS